jgi:hypothetical protein
MGKHMIRTMIAGLLLSWSFAASALSIESVAMMIDDAGEPGEEVEAFIATDHIQHFEITLDETKVGKSEFVVEFWAVETDAASNVKVTDFKAGGLIANTLKAQVSLPRDWPVGSYRLDVKMDGKVIGSYDYEVGAP